MANKKATGTSKVKRARWASNYNAGKGLKHRKLKRYGSTFSGLSELERKLKRLGKKAIRPNQVEVDEAVSSTA